MLSKRKTPEFKTASGVIVHSPLSFFPKSPEPRWSYHQSWTKPWQWKMSHDLCPWTSTESTWIVTYITLKTSLCPRLHHTTKGLLAQDKKPWNFLLLSYGLCHLIVFTFLIGDERICKSLWTSQPKDGMTWGDPGLKWIVTVHALAAIHH